MPESASRTPALVVLVVLVVPGLLGLLGLLQSGCATSRPAAPPPAPGRETASIEPGVARRTGLASYYGRRFHGRRTANGERFDMHALTAAHRTLPFGTRVRVREPATGRQVVVRINDRGPARLEREIDLSLAAAKRLGLTGPGVAPVELEILAPSTEAPDGD